MANHSCIPNAMVQFVGRRAILRAERDMKQDDEIEISYTGTYAGGLQDIANWLDYTDPLVSRQQSLAPYNFECSCRRCQDDLTVYQVCASSNVELNQYCLAADTQKLRIDASIPSEKIATARSQCRAMPDLPQDLQQRKAMLQTQLSACQSLIAQDLWAVSPLPQTLTETSIYFAEEGDYASALAVASLVASRCDPFRFVAPFHPVRAKNLFMMVKLLSNTAAETSSNTAAQSKTGLAQRLQSALREIDQVSLSQMLLYMVLDSAPAAYAKEWDLAVLAQEIMDGIDGLQGREQELSLIRAWREKPAEDKNKAFFEYAVVQQVEVLAELGKSVIAEFST